MSWTHWICSLKDIEVRFNEPMHRHTSMRVGGPAEAWMEPRSTNALKEVWRGLIMRGVPRIAIGAGTNVIFEDGGFSGAVVCLGKNFSGIGVPLPRDEKYLTLKAQAGLRLGRLLKKLWGMKLGGADFLAGVPGTVGGALVMNAGMKNESISQIVESVEGIDGHGRDISLDASELKFGYRYANIPPDTVITSVSFRLRPAERKKIEKALRERIAERRRTQPMRGWSAGSIFKNPRNNYAGRLIESSGLKGLRVGGAYVSRKHANFIINDGTARARDVMELIRMVRNLVEEKRGVKLELEVQMFGKVSGVTKG